MGTSDYIALASLAVAVSAFGIAVWQGWLSRRHNILSVKPRLQFNLSTLDGLHLYMENQGLGPAVIKNIIIKYKNTIFENPEIDPYPDIFEQERLYGYEYKFHMPTKENSYLPNSKLTLLSLSPVEPKGDPNAELSEFIGNLMFEITYDSIYGNEECTFNSGKIT